MRKPAFCICENKDADQLRGNREADQRLCFATQIVQSLFFLNTKFQASSHLLWVNSLVCIGPGRKPRRPVFSQRGSNRSRWMPRLICACTVHHCKVVGLDIMRLKYLCIGGWILCRLVVSVRLIIVVSGTHPVCKYLLYNGGRFQCCHHRLQTRSHALQQRYPITIIHFQTL